MEGDHGGALKNTQVANCSTSALRWTLLLAPVMNFPMKQVGDTPDEHT